MVELPTEQEFKKQMLLQLTQHANALRADLQRVIDAHERHDHPFGELVHIYIERLRIAAAVLDAPLDLQLNASAHLKV